MGYLEQYSTGIKKVHGRLFDHLPDRDIILIVLRGHLLIEERMTDLINQLLKKPEALKDARLSFYQKLSIVHAFFGDIKNVPTFWDCIEKLNVIRNRYSHNLAPEDIRKDLIAFLDLFFNDENHHVLTSDDKFTDKDIAAPLRKCMVMLFIGLQGALDGYRAATHFERKGDKPDQNIRG
jgi:hypothetical protein